MSTEVATDATDIAEVMANAGQLGIQNDPRVVCTGGKPLGFGKLYLANSQEI